MNVRNRTKQSKWMMYSCMMALALLLSACGSNNTATNTTGQQQTGNEAEHGAANSGSMETAPSNTNDMDNDGDDSDNNNDMEHNDAEEAPDDMKVAAHPEFAVGSQVIIQADHMTGMKGAQATVRGAYDTTVYSVSYTPTTGEQPVNNHKWVVHEELEDATATPYQVGDQVILDADHMKGMDGAQATIDSAQQATVYMVDYTPTNGGQPVKNHKWLTADELSAN